VSSPIGRNLWSPVHAFMDRHRKLDFVCLFVFYLQTLKNIPKSILVNSGYLNNFKLYLLFLHLRYFDNENQIYHFVTKRKEKKIHCASLYRRFTAFQALYSKTGRMRHFYLPRDACTFFHFQYKDGYTNNWRTQQCLYMKLNCDNRVHRWRTHQYL